MSEITCSGWPASWVNAWLAAVGATALDERIMLSWTDDTEPTAVLLSDAIDPLKALSESWPDTETLSNLPIAENWRGEGTLQRKVPVEEFARRASAARSHRQSWTLSSTLTDLIVDRHGEALHAPFDPAGPGTIKWLHHRLLKVHTHVTCPLESIQDSLAGQAERVRDNGLGFDQTRLGSLEDATDPWVDPIIEVLAFFGLSILPLRGRGVDGRLHRSANLRVRQKGWRNLPGRDEPLSFCWPAWGQPLDRDAIDALLDTWHPERRRAWPQLGVHAAWCTVPFQRRSDADATRGYGSERI